MREADEFLKSYLAAFPKVDEYMQKTIADAKRDGYVSTLFGRRRALPELQSSNFQVRASGERMARNTPIQGTAADIIKLAMIGVDRALREQGLRSRMVLQIHDELMLEVPNEEIEPVKRILMEQMEKVVSLKVPLTVESNYGKNWLEAH